MADTFGYNTTTTGYDQLHDKIRGSVGTPTESGEADSITINVHFTDPSGTNRIKCAIYKLSDLSLIGETAEREVTRDDSQGWETFVFSEPKPSLVADTEYLIVGWANNDESDVWLHRAATSGGATRYKTDAYDGTAFPNPLVSPSSNEYKMSIYCTYTPSGAEETASYTPLSVVLTVPSITATFALTATITAISLLVSVPAVSATHVSELSATFTPASVVLTVPSTTASYVQAESATFTSVSAVLTIPAITATSGQAEDSAFDSLSVVLTIPATTATYASELSAEYTALSIVATIPLITATYPSEFSAVYSALSLLLEVPSMTATHWAVYNATKHSADVTNLSKHSADITNIAKHSASVTNATKHDASVTNATKHTATITNISKT